MKYIKTYEKVTHPIDVGDYVILYLPEFFYYVQDFVGKNIGKLIEYRPGYDSPYVIQFEKKDCDECCKKLNINFIENTKEEIGFQEMCYMKYHLQSKIKFIKILEAGHPFQKKNIIFHSKNKKDCEEYFIKHKEHLEKMKGLHIEEDPYGEEMWDDENVNETYDFKFTGDEYGKYFDKPLIGHKYEFFNKDNLRFLVYFRLVSRDKKIYEQDYGTYTNGYWDRFVELGTFDAIGITKTIVEITLDFIRKFEPNQIISQYLPTEKEKEKFGDFFSDIWRNKPNKRSLLNKTFMENAIPEDYTYELKGSVSYITKIGFREINENLNIDPYNEEIWEDEFEYKAGDKLLCLEPIYSSTGLHCLFHKENIRSNKSRQFIQLDLDKKQLE